MNTTTDTATSTTYALEMHGVSKAYKHFQLKNVHLQIEQGTVAGLIGPNGAGKSTTMRILMGLVKPDHGTVSVLGQPISSTESAAKQEIGYFADDMRLYKLESIAWHMQFVRSLFPSWDDDYAQKLLSRFGLIAKQAIKGLSHGQRVKAMLLLILARQPRLLILDEPTNGLDPVAKHEILTELMRVVEDENRTILYSSHQTQDVEQISDSITFIDRGEVIASQNCADYLERWKRIKLRVSANWQTPSLPGLRAESSLGQLRVFSMSQFDDRFIEQLEASGAAIEAVEAMTLEEIFVSSVFRGRDEVQS